MVLVSVRLADRKPVVHVLAIGAGVRELLEALAALERFLAGMQPLVLGEVMLVLKRFRALQTLVRSLT